MCKASLLLVINKVLWIMKYLILSYFQNDLTLKNCKYIEITYII